jgi:2-polyprenyl-3-methyl-5-hydroxy-6-metoxy-1,4-benzoquinol methylase
MKRLSFNAYRQVGRIEWQVQRHLLVQHYLQGYRPPFHPERKHWAAQRALLLRHYVRGPLGIHRRIRHTRVVNAVQNLGLLADARILDAGCGHAYATLWLALHYPGYQITAVEIEPDLVESARRAATALGLGNVEFIQRDITTLRDEGIYDLVVSMDVLEHIEDDVEILHGFYRALRPGGQLLLHLPRRHQEHWRFFPAFREHTTPEHVRDEYTAEEIREKLDQAGFQIEYLRYGFSPWGEMAFELNNLFWRHMALRLPIALILHPLCVWLGYMDTRQDYDDGNSLLILARPAQSLPSPEAVSARREEPAT